MFLSFWSEYLNFFIVLFSTLAVIVIAYLVYVLRSRRFSHEDTEFDATILKKDLEEANKPEEVEEPVVIHDDDIPIPDDLPEIITDLSDLRHDEDHQPVPSEEKIGEAVSAEKERRKSKLDRLEETLRSLDPDEIPDEDNKSNVDIAFENDEDDDDEDDEEKKLGKRYHVLYRKEDNKWYVKREGTDKITRVLESQKEAIAFATIKAINQNTTVVVHKRDGKIRKYAL